MTAAALLLVVDAANVIGSRPDGWWRDRAGAVRRLRDALATALAEGFELEVLDANAEPPAPASVVPPEIVLVTEGAARSVVGVPGVEVAAAAGSGDDTIVEVVAARAGGRSVVVVTADRELRRRVQEYGASILGPGRLLDFIRY